LSEENRASPKDKFPTRILVVLTHSCHLTSRTVTCTKSFVRAINAIDLRRVARECVLINSGSLSPGHDIQKWRPWLTPIYTGSPTWMRRNSITLASAVAAFRVSRLSIRVSFLKTNAKLDPRRLWRALIISAHTRFQIQQEQRKSVGTFWQNFVYVPA
jgi:hypothetical protein